MLFYIFFSLTPFMAFHAFKEWPLPVEMWIKFNKDATR
jgi:hypothetical protein